MNLIGPSYSLDTRRAAVQRAINYMLRQVEPGNEKSGFYLEQAPGLTLFSALGAEFRGGWWTGRRAFAVAGSTLYELNASGVATSLGTLNTSTGPVDFAQGLLSLGLVDGGNGYVLTLADSAFAQITDTDFYGSHRVAFLDGKFIFVRPDTQQFYYSESIDDADSYDALDFASAESQPDNIVAHVVNFRELIFAGEFGVEVWSPYATGDQVYQRNNGANMEVGCAACHSMQRVDNGLMWVGQDRNGSGMVWIAYDYRPQRVSNFAVEEALKRCTDLSQVRAFTYQRRGQTFYVLNGPGMETSWVFDLANKQWHERAEGTTDNYSPWRPLAHFFAFGENLMGDVDGNLYRVDDTSNKFGDDIICRERISPNDAAPSRNRKFFDRLDLDVTVGLAPQGISPVIELRYSDDGGFTWGGWRAKSLGEVGQYSQSVAWTRCGSARDRVWHLRCSSDSKASLVGAAVTAREGLS